MHRSDFVLLLRRLLAVLTIAVPLAAGAQSSDFNDGKDTGWTHYSPLAPFGAGATYTFPDGMYRITAPPSPDLATFGPSRAGSLRADKAYTRLQASVEITDLKSDINQSIGLIAHVTDVGLGQTKGYTFNYNTRSGFSQMVVVNNEAPGDTLKEAVFKLNVTDPYRLVFTLVDTTIFGQIFSVTNPAVPLHGLSGVSDVYPGGVTGLFAFALTPDQGIDARFDNYTATAPALVPAAVLKVAPAPNEIPQAPIDSVVAQLLNVETEIDSGTLVLKLDGADAPLDVQQADAFIVATHLPNASLDPAQPHHALLTFNDTQGPRSVEWNFGKPKAAAPATLESSANVATGYASDATAVLDSAASTFAVPVPGGSRFYRVVDSTARLIVSVALNGAGDALLIKFQ